MDDSLQMMDGYCPFDCSTNNGSPSKRKSHVSIHSPANFVTEFIKMSALIGRFVCARHRMNISLQKMTDINASIALT